jgi:hypothetical protein
MLHHLLHLLHHHLHPVYAFFHHRVVLHHVASCHCFLCPPIAMPPCWPLPIIIGPPVPRIVCMLSCMVCTCSCTGFWRFFGSVVALSYFICCCISFMLSFIWDICLSMPMLIAGLAGAGLSRADAISADGAPATIAESSIEVFIVVFPLGLNKFMFPLPATTGRQGLP